MKKNVICTIYSILLIYILFFTTNTYSQTKKETIAIAGITNQSSIVDDAFMEHIYQAIVTGFVKKGRFNIIDKQQLGFVENETERVSSGTISIESSTFLDKVNTMGANYLITANITSIAPSKIMHKAQDGSTYPIYVVSLQFVLNAINPLDGSVIASENINEEEISREGYIQAYNDVVNSLGYEIDLFIQKYFPIKILIAELNSVKKGKVKTLTIIGGSGLGLRSGDRLKVVEYSTFKGIKRTKELGIIVVKKVQDENFSLCKVSSGGEEILNRFNAGIDITCITIVDSESRQFFKDFLD